MPTFQYRAKKGPQKIIEGTVEALSEKEAVEKISLMGCLPIHLTLQETVQMKGVAEQSSHHPIRFLGKIRPREITVFTRQLASLLKSGVPILNAIQIISDQSENFYLRNLLQNIHTQVKEGTPLSSALTQYPAIFSHLYIAMIRAGEDSGVLPEVLFRIANYRIKQEEILSRIRMASAYPILMAITGLGTVIFMLTVVMPRLMRVFSHMDQSLPLPTQILISVSSGLRHYWIWIVLIT